jgi:hypothetical protein
VQCKELPLLFAAGSNRKIRMWDLKNIDASRADVAGGIFEEPSVRELSQ